MSAYWCGTCGLYGAPTMTPEQHDATRAHREAADKSRAILEHDHMWLVRHGMAGLCGCSTSVAKRVYTINDIVEAQATEWQVGYDAGRRSMANSGVLHERDLAVEARRMGRQIVHDNAVAREVTFSWLKALETQMGALTAGPPPIENYVVATETLTTGEAIMAAHQARWERMKSRRYAWWRRLMRYLFDG